MMESYIVVDLETTGLDPKKDKIIEIGAARVIDGVIIDSFKMLLNPGRKLSDKVKEITGICDEDLEKAPDIIYGIKCFMDFLEVDELPFLGHSILFDYSFLKRAAVNQGYLLEKSAIDTLKIARKFLPDMESRNLNYLCNYYNIPHQAHRALPDAISTHYLYQKLVENFFSKETADPIFHPVPLVYQVKREGPASKRQKERVSQLLKKHHIEADFDINMLTRNEANRYVDQILSTYGR